MSTSEEEKEQLKKALLYLLVELGMVKEDSNQTVVDLVRKTYLWGDKYGYKKQPE